MKLFSLLLAVFIGLNISAIAAPGDKLPGQVAFSGTCSLSGTTGSVLTPVHLPANGGTFVLTGADIIILDGTAVSVAPTIQIASGATNLSSAAALSGTAANTVIRPTLSAPLPVVTSGTAVAPLSVNITSAGTATALDVKAVFRGYWLP